ncbi:ribonuclease CAF1, partial [Thamnocephalis sphaerospora]
LTRHNLTGYTDEIASLIRGASYVAVDCEFTGLGLARKNTRASNIEDRYVALRELVSTHALVAIGLSIFSQQPTKGERATTYSVCNIQLLLSCMRDYTVSPESMRFLIDNGYDLNRLVRDGIPYQPADSLSPSSTAPPLADTAASLRHLMGTLITAGRPLIVHNGWLDLLFLYHSFHAPLPAKLGSFVADMCEMFPAGVWDTKYTADYIAREPASFLALLFRKSEREQERRRLATASTQSYIQCLTYMPTPRRRLSSTDATARTNLSSQPANAQQGRAIYCEQYASHGHCPLGRQCPLSHSLDIILDAQEQRGRSRRDGSSKQPSSNAQEVNDAHEEESGPKRKRGRRGGKRRRVDGGDLAKAVDALSVHSQPAKESDKQAAPSAEPISSAELTGYHAAYFDAYMTGFLHAAQRLTQQEAGDTDETQLRAALGDRLYLIGKNMPLQLRQSAFARTSDGHRQRMQEL